MDANEQQKLEEFILTQLQKMGKNIEKSYEKNKTAREHNPFLCFSPGIDKFMGLGRSIDSQLGNRMQNIIFYLCRLRYGKQAIPNIVALNVDRSSSQIVLDFFYVETDMDISKFYACKNPCAQNIYFDQVITLDEATEMIGVKKRVLNKTPNIIKQETIRCTASSEQISYVIEKNSGASSKKTKQPVDLLIVKTTEAQTEITAFEIKMSGNLDTKNASSNAKEVEDLYRIFQYVQQNASYFAVCYGECSEAVRNSIKNEAPHGSTLDETGFWNMVLPNTGAYALTYQEFKNIYAKAFADSGLEKTIKELGV